MLGPQHNQAQTKNTKKNKRNKCRLRLSDEHENNSQPLRPPEKYHHAPRNSNRRIRSNIFNKENDDADAAAAARTSPRVSPRYAEVIRERYTRHPSGRNGGTHRCRRVGVRQADRDFSRPTPPPPRTIRTAPPHPSSTSVRHHGLEAILAAAQRSPTRGLEVDKASARSGIAAAQQCRREQPPPPKLAVVDRT